MRGLEGGERREASQFQHGEKNRLLAAGGGMLFPEALTQAASCIPHLSEEASGCSREELDGGGGNHPPKHITSAICFGGLPLDLRPKTRPKSQPSAGEL